ncbi:amino acid adenylation domain-containing protein [Amaricoccus sp.]|uniref:amino acid adenylation domain-containing protein n=1 Tax=Amaricoccus sp. TaxID=1872485 RepID=UPI001B696508|nr:amino acid adenylation domain-containing protein [Amaricoccus sp.]MBP7241274.1 amino acid adenylation domain-containing protein [Amaricoccus sp.]
MSTIEDIYELSPMQAGMLFHTICETDARPYFEQVVIPFEGAVDMDALSRAWNSVAAANPALRTSVHWEALDKPVQVVRRGVTVPIEEWDLRHVAAGRREAAFQERLAEDRARGFDLEAAPLMRIALARMTEGSRRMVLSFHHVILDGWSLQAVFGQFSDAYASLVAGRTPAPRPARPYRAFIEWLQARDPAHARRHWAEALRDAPGPSGIAGAVAPVAAPGAAPEDFDEIGCRLSAAETERLRAAGQARKLTLNTLLQGAWALVLSRFAGSEDVVYGVTVSGRPAEIAGVEGMIGLFINTVPLRVRVPDRAGVVEWLSALQADQLRARDFDHCSLVQIRDWAGLPAERPLFDTILAFENYPIRRTDDGARAEVTFIERTNYPLSVAVVPGDGLRIRLLHDTRAMTRERVEEIGAALRATLVELAAALGASVPVTLGDVFSATAPEIALVDMASSYPRASIPELFDEIATRYPEAAALEQPGRPVSYSGLSSLAHSLAAEMAGLGVRPGDRVAILAGSTVNVAAAMLATLRLGAAYVPLDAAYPHDRLAAILQETRARLIVTDTEHRDRAGRLGVPLLSLGSGAVATAGQGEPPEVRVDPEAIAYVMFTSGSTGRPKGIEIPHRAIVRLVRNTNYVDIGPGDRLARHSNCAFDATTFEIWGALLNGAAAVEIDRDTMLTPDRLAETIAARGVTTMFLTTALLNRIVAERPDSLAGLDTLMFGGEAADVEAVRALLDARHPARILHVYGPTESTTFATWHRVDRVEEGQRTLPIGREIAHTTAYVLDRALRPVPAGAPGELFLGGDGLARGYFGQPALTAEAFLPDPFSATPGRRLYRTGDRVRRDAAGRLVFLERIDAQVKVRGYRIEPGEIEALLLADPEVDEAVTLLRGNGDGRSILAYVGARNARPDALADRLMQELAARLPSYMLPAGICVLDTLPITPNGKIDRRALPAPGDIRPSRDLPDVVPDATEAQLLKIWSAVLERDDIGVHDNFFDIGGHSLRATQLASRIRRELGIDVALRTIFENPTVAALARATGTAAAEPPAAPDAPQPTPSREDGIKPVSRTTRQRRMAAAP